MGRTFDEYVADGYKLGDNDDDDGGKTEKHVSFKVNGAKLVLLII